MLETEVWKWSNECNSSFATCLCISESHLPWVFSGKLSVMSSCYFLFWPLCTWIDPVTRLGNVTDYHGSSYQPWNIDDYIYITIHSLTIFKWKMRNLRLNLIYLSFFVQYISNLDRTDQRFARLDAVLFNCYIVQMHLFSNSDVMSI